LRQQLSRTLYTYRELLRIRRYKSKMTTPVYHDYWSRCRREAGDLGVRWPEAGGYGEQFRAQGFTVFWTPELQAAARSVYQAIREEEERGLPIWNDVRRYLGFYTRFPELHAIFEGQLGDFIKAANGSHFKIYYGVLYKSVHDDGGPIGSQLWHCDGGPGTCMNLMFYLKDVEVLDGAMECLPWKQTYRILSKELRSGETERRIQSRIQAGEPLSREEQRTIRCTWFAEQIAEGGYMRHVAQPAGPAGSVLAFRNNLLHRGGFPREPGRTRYVCVFHIYPSHKPAPLARYAAEGLEKRGPYPADPEDDF
jgi:hypothetical protein